MKITLNAPPPTPATDDRAPRPPQRVTQGLPIAMRPPGTALRRITTFAGTALAFLVALLMLEALLPNAAKPSKVIGTIIGSVEAEWGLQALAMKEAHAAALERERARAEQEIRRMQGEVEKTVAAAKSLADQELKLAEGQIAEITQAYATLYARAEALNKSYLEVATHVSKLRATLAAENQQGTADSVRVATWLEAAASMIKADELKDHFGKVRDEITKRSAADYHAMVSQPLPDPQLGPRWDHGLPDPAAIRAQRGVAAVAPRASDSGNTRVEARPAAPAPRYGR